jgi:hypothetical protein
LRLTLCQQKQRVWHLKVFWLLFPSHNWSLKTHVCNLYLVTFFKKFAWYF